MGELGDVSEHEDDEDDIPVRSKKTTKKKAKRAV
jgi:hypothetical protein